MKKDHAKAFAAKAHQGQVRKNSSEPYITHPIRVAERLEKEGCSDDLISAGYLHDVVEDTDICIEEIEQQFGKVVAELVASHTEDKSKSWWDRKKQTVDHLKDAPKEIKYLIIADKLDNLLELEKEHEELGDAIWKNFNAGYSQQKWYNQEIAKQMYAHLTANEIPAYFKEYEQAVKRFFK
ncbi:HD domain-containing protein [Oceanobacillus jeddahense]|uniref:HD domain-containing protein n=1 Tax=Oceanobacillus jeddahense TaxID=1462527 RepID=A0ABY5JUY4_9BACI|nr:HD domain-containing protein [Oceanobacillus jeddahense]UUI04080.1 HD domain-containing protein [Oceanobacillus jeddahense]